jgi:hypothetical protein
MSTLSDFIDMFLERVEIIDTFDGGDEFAAR